MIKHRLSLLLVLVAGCVLVACQSNHGSTPGKEEVDDSQDAPYAVSLLGEPLPAPQFSSAALKKKTAQLEDAKKKYEADVDNEDALIWYGRRLAYLGRYREAIQVFSDGVARFPDSARILRHRGHRYISTRRFDLAIADFERAAELARDKPDRIEPDGIPNALNQPIGTTKGNIWYHLGLARYLTGDLDGALRAYDRRRLQTDNNDDNRVSTAYWRYIILKRLGRHREADAAVTGVGPRMHVIENQSYWDLVLLFRGLKQPVDLQAGGDAVHDADVMNATQAYGLSMYDLLAGRVGEARRRWQAIVQNSKATTAFGYIAAEAELAR